MNRRRMASLIQCCIAVVLLWHCRGAAPAGAPAVPDFSLAAGDTLALAVNYETGQIAANDAKFQVLFRLEKKGAALTLVLDASRMGGGMITGTCCSFRGNEKLSQKAIRVLYQHVERVSLPPGTDRALLKGLVFLHVEE